jgi:hypothetical protein
MKPIVIVCGANHSKTSMLMEKLVELNNLLRVCRRLWM